MRATFHVRKANSVRRIDARALTVPDVVACSRDLRGRKGHLFGRAAKLPNGMMFRTAFCPTLKVAPGRINRDPRPVDLRKTPLCSARSAATTDGCAVRHASSPILADGVCPGIGTCYAATSASGSPGGMSRHLP